MSRKRKTEPFVPWKIHVPSGLAARVELLLWDPVLRKPRYGGRSALLELLLRRWVEEQEGERNNA